MLNVFQAKGCCISAASDSTCTTCKAIFELWCGFFRTILCQTRISKSNIQVKCYVAIVIYPTAKAVHLELVSNLKSGAYIATPRRFIARRESCLNLYFDNGATFIGAQYELRELRKLFASESHVKISGTCKFRRIHMAYYSPFGLQEVGVRCMKYQLNGRSHSIYFRRTNQSANSSRNISEF